MGDWVVPHQSWHGYVSINLRGTHSLYFHYSRFGRTYERWYDLVAAMKLIKHWFDERNNITNYLYEASNGVKLLSAVNPITTDVYVSAAFRAGSCFEPIVGVPHGTAHFLEHLFDNQNRVFKTRKAIDEFEYGDKGKPTLNINASTSKKYVYLYGYSNERGFDRLLTRLKSIIQYPRELFKDHIEEERKIILAEMMEDPKPEKDRTLSYDTFALGNQLPEFVHRIIGSYEGIKQLNADDIEKYYETMIGDRHAIFSVQSRVELSSGELAWFEEVASSLPRLTKAVEPPNEHLENFHDFCYFQDDRDEGVFYSFGYFQPVPHDIDYRQRTLFLCMGDLLNKLSFDILREKKGLIYGFDIFAERYLGFDHEVYGFSCNVETKNAKKALDAVEKLIYKESLEFLRSKAARKWFESTISTFVFPHTSAYDPEYAKYRATDIFEGREVYLFTKSIAVAKKLTLGDLLYYVERELIAKPPHVWVSASAPKEDMEKMLRSSKLAKRWEKVGR
jgi:predicted Zn-dependent peptidase